MGFSDERRVSVSNSLGTTSIKDFFKVTVAVNPASLDANTSAETDINLPGVDTGDLVFANVPASLDAGLAFSGIRVKSDGVVSIRLSNLTATPIDDTSRNWNLFIIKLG